MDKLFDRDRLPNGIKLVPLLFYLPVGILLCVLRLFMGLPTLVASALLRTLSAVRLVVLRGLCCSLGLVVIEENSKLRDETVRTIISNHISIMDHVALHLATGCESPVSQNEPAVIQYAFCISGKGRLVNLPRQIPIMDHQPEGAMTNGKVGVLKFKNIAMYQQVQPVSLRIWRPPMAEVSPNVIGATWLSDFLWFLIVPFTVITIRYLPVMRRVAVENDEEWTRRVQCAIAADLKLTPSDKTAELRLDLERQLLPLDVQLRMIGSHQMALRLKETFPLPFETIRGEIEKTKNMRLAIANLMRKVRERSNNVGSDAPFTECTDFPKSARDRMVSFQERKARLIESARKRYLEKRALNVASS